MSVRPTISVTMLLVVVPQMPKMYSTPSARSVSRTAWPAFICAMQCLRMNRLLQFEYQGVDQHQQDREVSDREHRHVLADVPDVPTDLRVGGWVARVVAVQIGIEVAAGEHLSDP